MHQLFHTVFKQLQQSFRRTAIRGFSAVYRNSGPILQEDCGEAISRTRVDRCTLSGFKKGELRQLIAFFAPLSRHLEIVIDLTKAGGAILATFSFL